MATSRCDAVAEALGAALRPKGVVAPSPSAALGEAWDTTVVRSWIDKKVTQLQGFNDQIVIDTLMRAVAPVFEASSSSTAHATTAAQRKLYHLERLRLPGPPWEGSFASVRSLTR